MQVTFLENVWTETVLQISKHPSYAITELAEKSSRVKAAKGSAVELAALDAFLAHNLYHLLFSHETRVCKCFRPPGGDCHGVVFIHLHGLGPRHDRRWRERAI